MKTFNSIEELKPYLNEGTNTYIFNENVRFNFNLSTSANIKAPDIKAWNINAGDIKAWNVTAFDIKARNIEAYEINAYNIFASDINAYNLDAWNIFYFAFCIAYKSFACESVLGRRTNSIHKCLDGDIIIKKPKKKKIRFAFLEEITEEQRDAILKILRGEL